MVALGRQAAIDGAGADSDQHLAMGAHFPEHMHVFRIADAAFDKADVAGAEMLDVGDRRTVEIGDFHQLQQALVDIEQRHVAAETAA